MAQCVFCNSTILMGGVRHGVHRFCNKKCYQNTCILSVTKNVPASVLDGKVEEIWRGKCPKCEGTGPVDVHKVYEVWSALALTRWTTKSQVSCRSCASKSQLGGVAFSFFLGWWGLPWGLILTPVQITRNVVGICRGPEATRASQELRKLVLVNIGAQMMTSQKAAGTQPPPLPRGS
jgi:hypothetical protein